jgi:RNA polymerase sigma-70 factor (ECF subfamily)
MKKENQDIETLRRGDEAMNRYAAGDDRAFAELHAVAAPLVTRYLARRLRDRSELPDLVQETFFRVHRARRSFVPGSPVMPWLLTIAHRQLIETHRRCLRQKRTDSARLERLTHHGSAGMLASAEELVAAQELASHLDRSLASVSEPQRAALRLVKGEGLSNREAAAALGTTITGIKLRTHRACRFLRAELAMLAVA